MSPKGFIQVYISPADACIADLVCVTVCPRIFGVSGEGSIVIREEYRVHGDPWRGSVPRELEKCVSNASALCPTKIIHYS